MRDQLSFLTPSQWLTLLMDPSHPLVSRRFVIVTDFHKRPYPIITSGASDGPICRATSRLISAMGAPMIAS